MMKDAQENGVEFVACQMSMDVVERELAFTERVDLFMW